MSSFDSSKAILKELLWFVNASLHFTNLSSDEEEKNSHIKTKPHVNELSDGKAKPIRHAYVRKPFLYSKYFSDSDDERTVEQRRQSIVSVGIVTAHILTT